MFDFVMIGHPHNRASFGKAKTFQGKAMGMGLYIAAHTA